MMFDMMFWACYTDRPEFADMSAELPEQDRKRFAAKAVRDIMKEI